MTIAEVMTPQTEYSWTGTDDAEPNLKASVNYLWMCNCLYKRPYVDVIRFCLQCISIRDDVDFREKMKIN